MNKKATKTFMNYNRAFLLFVMHSELYYKLYTNKTVFRVDSFPPQQKKVTVD